MFGLVPQGVGDMVMCWRQGTRARGRNRIDNLTVGTLATSWYTMVQEQFTVDSQMIRP